VRQETDPLRGQGVKLQHFAAVFTTLPGMTGRTILLFLYLVRSGEGMEVIELTV
jgi:anaerobic magnesium-protoporphyrin IX monomethyl ester cyclase